MKLSQATTYATALLCPEIPVLFIGPPGIGKTESAKTIAKARNERIVINHPGTSIPDDYRGIARVVEKLAEWFPIGTLRSLVAPDCPPTLLLIDDIAQARGPVQAALMHVVRERMIGDAALSPNVSILLCSNEQQHDIHAHAFSAPLLNRVLILRIEHDYEAFARWALSCAEIDAVVIGYALFRRDCFTEAVPETDNAKAFCTPRTLAIAGQILKRLPTVSEEAIAGLIGHDTATDLFLYRQSVDTLVSLDHLRIHPNILKQTRDPGLLYAYVVQMAQRTLAGETFDDLLPRFCGEFNELFHHLCMKETA